MCAERCDPQKSLKKHVLRIWLAPNHFVKPYPLNTVPESGMTTQLDASAKPSLPELQYIQYDPDKEAQYLPAIRELISKDLSEPYSIYVYRYFLYQWADLCYMVGALLFQSSEIVQRDRSPS